MATLDPSTDASLHNRLRIRENLLYSVHGSLQLSELALNEQKVMAMARAAAAPPRGAISSNSSSSFLVDELRSMSANLMNIRQTIMSVEAQAAGKEHATDAGFAKATDLLNKVWSKDKGQVDRAVTKIDTWVSEPGHSTGYRFELEEIQNLWDRICFLWPVDNSWTRENASALAQGLLTDIDLLIEKCAFITLSPRIQEHLATIRVGRYKAFGDIAQGETVDEAMNKRLLQRFAASPESFDGYFDLEKMRIARLDRGMESKWPALIAIVISFVVPILLSIPTYIFREDVPYAQDVFGDDGYAPFLIYVVLAFVGALSHILMKARAAKNPDGTPAGVREGVDWLVLNYTSVCWSIGAVWLASIIARTDFLEIDSQMSGLVVGYSADSIVDKFTRKFTTVMNTARDSALDNLKPEDQRAG